MPTSEVVDIKLPNLHILAVYFIHRLSFRKTLLIIITIK